MSEQTSARTIAGVERAIDVLNLFAEDGVRSLGVTEIAQRLDLSKAVVHRLLSSFRAKDYLRLDEDRRYTLGPRILTLGLSYLDRLDIQELGRAALHDLSARTNETATLSVRAGLQRVYVDQVVPPRDVKMVVQLGGSYPLYAGSSSKAMLAFLPEELCRSYLDAHPLEPLTDVTITDRRALERDLALVRERGYAVSLGERQAGSGSVAAPVLAHDGQVQAVISACGPLERFRDEIDTCAEHLLDVTRALSARMGFRGS